MKERLKNNIEILKQHNLTHEPVYHITDGKKHEIDLINEIVADCEEIFNDEEQGLIVRLPCKVGDKVYLALGGCKIPAITTAHLIEINSNGILINGMLFGKTVFLTRAEAEKKLKEIKFEDRVKLGQSTIVDDD